MGGKTPRWAQFAKLLDGLQKPNLVTRMIFSLVVMASSSSP
jgi:hypothetical protein